MKKLLVTAALPYSNGHLHVGHLAGCYLPADIYVRFQRLEEREVLFICGSDDHGVAIMLTSEKEGRTPAETAKYYHDSHQQDFKQLGINFDIYSGTSQNPYHYQFSQNFFLSLNEKGHLKKITGRQFFDEARNMFLPDRFVKGTCGYCNAVEQNGDQCEECGKALDVDHLTDAHSVISGESASIRETVHWYIDLGRFEGQVKDWYEKSFLRDHTKSFLKGLLGTGLIERSMTRDLSWGIPVPLEEPDAEGKVLYVWFDAPIGYISNTEEFLKASNRGSYEEWWKSSDTEILHYIGEDNTIFHCIIWIAMLSAEGSYELPSGVVANQFLNIQFPGKEVEKISKSRGTAVWIRDYLSSGKSPDALRYYLTSIAPERARGVFKPEDLIQKNNTDLANTIGNFVNRILSFTAKHYGPNSPDYDEAVLDDIDREFLACREEIFQKVTSQLREHHYKGALETLMEFARECNRFVDERAPWKTRKEDEGRTRATLALCIQGIHTLGVCLQPFLPHAAGRLLEMLWGSSEEKLWAQALHGPSAGHPFGEISILFDKLEYVSE